MPKFKLKWAFNLGPVTSVRGQPAVAGNRVFATTLSGDVYAIDARNGLGREVGGEDLDRALEAFADYADIKSPFTLGHSRGVAQLAAAAAATLGLPALRKRPTR